MRYHDPTVKPVTCCEISPASSKKVFESLTALRAVSVWNVCWGEDLRHVVTGPGWPAIGFMLESGVPVDPWGYFIFVGRSWIFEAGVSDVVGGI